MTAVVERWRDRGGTAAAVSWTSELALVAVSAAAAVALARAFRTWDALWPLLGIVVLAHAWCLAARLLRLGAVASLGIGLALGVVVIGLVYYRDVTVLGLPTGDALATIGDDVRRAFAPFNRLVAPVDDLPGFTVTFAVALWLMALFADLAASRSAAPLQAVVTPVAVFVVSSILLLGRHAMLASVVMVAALTLFRLSVRATAVRTTAASPAGSTRSTWTAGIVMLVGVLLGGVVLNGFAPAPDDGVVDLRAIGRGPKSRVVESPLVSLDAMLGNRSTDRLFTVTSSSPDPHYWRLTALDDFDGRSWSASARYTDLDDDERIASPWDPAVSTVEETYRVEVDGLRSDWLPAPFAPVAVSADVALRHEPGSSSVFVAEEATAAGIDFEVRSAVAVPDAATLANVSGTAPASHADELALPETFPDVIRNLAGSITEGLDPFEAMTALERFFLNQGPLAESGRFTFTYDRAATYRDYEDPLVAFVYDGRGFCQQFATAFAAMARAVGVPARVAVGFTYGDRDRSADGTTTWTVRGRHAHAWPEVFLDGVGWIAFEPTPGRGNPDATNYSNNPPAQADATGGSVELGATTTTTTTIAPAGGVVAPTTVPENLPRPADVGTSADDPISTAPLVVLAALAGAVALAGLAAATRVAWVRRRRVAARDGDDTRQRVAVSWQQTCDDLRRVGITARDAETPLEFGRRAAKMLEVRQLTTLAHRESDRRFRADAPADVEATEAEEISDEVREVVWSRLDRAQRWRAELDG